ncbi:MAG: GNAT family N-acetyltransferase [Patescibacteria group bacterium]
MDRLKLRKIVPGDKKYFTKWWRDKELLTLTSGILRRIADQKIEKYFSRIVTGEKSAYHFLITVGKTIIGHISFVKRKSAWYETQIIIGEKEYRDRGYGTIAIKKMLEKAQGLDINKIYLEVRPNNARAIRAYEKSGFKKSEIIKYPNNKNLPETLKMVFVCED